MVSSVKIHRIKQTLKKYFRQNDKIKNNEQCDEIRSAEDVLNEIHEIVGDFKNGWKWNKIWYYNVM